MYAAHRAPPPGQAAAERENENQGDGLIPDEEDDGVQTDPVDEYDALFGDGSDLNGIDLPDDAALSPDEARCWSNFDAAVDAVTRAACGCCREEGFNIQLKASGFCARCHSDKGEVKTWSDENNVNPMAEILRPECLKNLTDMEEMLIARVKPVMQVRWTRG
ncbi:hypothetical protein B0H13DRAFT_1604262, partial [Mycena leptocephala]